MSDTTGTALGLRWRNLLVDGPELWAIAALASAVALWGVPTLGSSALVSVPFGLGLGYFCILAGRLVIGALRLPEGRFGDLPTVVLVGFLALNLLLLAASLASPLPLPVDAASIGAGLVIWALRGGRPVRRSGPPGLGLACLVLSLVAATSWSVDSIVPTASGRGEVVFKPWVDGYPHACFTRIFRDVRGAWSLEHFSLSGEPAPFYHYGCFLVPSLLASTTGMSCYLAFATFLVPMGMALSGLAAFAMARWWWGPGAGLAATVGVLLVPDASSYGIANPYLGYFWMAEIGPTWVYAIALMAVAWVLVFEGCRAGRPGLVAAGFVAAGLTVAFKAHLFVANALLVWVYPAFFLRDYSSRARLAWLAFSLGTFAVAVRASQRFEGVPLLRLDGSGMKPYLSQVAFNLNDPEMRRAFEVGPGTTWAHDVVAGLVHLTFGTFGALALAFPVLAILLIAIGRGGDRRSRVESAVFPAMVTANYLVMALGLARDDRTRHMPDELLHRPLTWAYFAVAAWTAGSAYEVLLKSRLDRPGAARSVAVVAVLVLLFVPLYLGPGVQVGPGWGKDLTSLRLPAGFVRCAEFLRDRTAKGDVVQNSEDDRWIILGALAERPVYVADTWRTPEQANPIILKRLEEMARFRALVDPAEIAAFARDRKIAWYVLGPSTKIRWPASILARPAFESGGFRVYRFEPPG